MLRDLARGWWLVHIRGVFTVLFGAVLIFLTGSMRGELTTAVVLVGVLLVFILYLFASGLLSLATAVISLGSPHRWITFFVHGAILVTLAVWLFLSNQFTLKWLVWFTVANALASGILELLLTHAIHRHADVWALRLAAAASILMATFLILARNEAASTVVFILGVYAISYGASLIVFSFRLHGWRSPHVLHSA